MEPLSDIRTHKMVVIWRKDLKVKFKGKIFAQLLHAAFGTFLQDGEFVEDCPDGPYLKVPLDDNNGPWIKGIFTKIALTVSSEAELLDIYKRAQEAGINCALIQDRGLTEFDNVPTYTAVGIGPDESIKIDKITGHLSLL